jgi:hypothetical protein
MNGVLLLDGVLELVHAGKARVLHFEDWLIGG